MKDSKSSEMSRFSVDVPQFGQSPKTQLTAKYI